MKKTLTMGMLFLTATTLAFAVENPTNPNIQPKPPIPMPGEHRGMDNGQKRGMPFVASGTPMHGDTKGVMPCNTPNASTSIPVPFGMFMGQMGDIKMPSTGDPAMDTRLMTLRKEMDTKIRAIMEEYAPKFKAVLGDKILPVASGTPMMRGDRGDGKTMPCGNGYGRDDNRGGMMNGNMNRPVPAKGPTGFIQNIFRSLFGGDPQEVEAQVH